jgi:hypothetical protein
MAQNDPMYQVGSRVLVYESGIIAGMAARYQINTTPQVGTIVQLHASESGVAHVRLEGTGEHIMVTDMQRLRPAPQPSDAA